jgi:eukaryotic-like serine/threonine-protein kinase
MQAAPAPSVVASTPDSRGERENAMRELLVGDRLDQYKITELLARSGMATIWQAIDVESGATVVLKVPHLQYESDIVFHERFAREQRIGQRLDHPNIVKVLSPRDPSRIYLAMELVEGTSLRAMVQNKPLPTQQALDIARQIAGALAYMHENGVVHRDLKPENVMVTAEGRIKLLDFGIAMDTLSRRLTWTRLSNAVGTPDFMAPEQIVGKRGDARTDIYALGTILYEMLTGELPFSGPNVNAILRAKTNGDPTLPSHYQPDLDPHLERIVMNAIARLPRDRYASASAMLADLADPGKVDLAAQPIVRESALLRIPPRRLVALIFGVLIILLLALTLYGSRHKRAPEGPSKSYRGEVVP